MKKPFIEQLKKGDEEDNDYEEDTESIDKKLNRLRADRNNSIGNTRVKSFSFVLS